MKILVAVKMVPRLGQVRFAPGLNRIVREDVATGTNPLDIHALNHALRLRTRAGGEVVAFTMGPPGARQVLEEALQRGADRAIHLVDIRFAGADTLATARALAQLFRRERPQLILFGRSSLDGGTAQTAPQVAELAGLPQLTQVISLEISDGQLDAVREVERGCERWRVPLPAVISVEAAANLPPDAAVADGSSVNVAIESLDVDALGGDEADYGIRGSATYVQQVIELPGRSPADTVTDPAMAVRRLLATVGDTSTAGAAATSQDAPASATETGRQIWAMAEAGADRGLHPVSFEAIACARQASEPLGADVVSVLLCEHPGDTATALAEAGADRVIVVRGAGLTTTASGLHADALSQLIDERSPFAVIGPWTSLGRDYMPRVAARLGLGLTGDFVALDVSPRPGKGHAMDLVWLKPAWAGTVVARVVARTIPSLGTLRPGAVVAPSVTVGKTAPVELVAIDLAAATATPILVEQVVQPGIERLPELSPAVVCVGADITPELAAQIERAVDELGWAVGGTHEAVNQGLFPPQLEIDILKRSLAPSLVLAIGLRSPSELDAVRAAGIIATVDPDPTSPVHNCANLRVLCRPEDFVAQLAVGQTALVAGR